LAGHAGLRHLAGGGVRPGLGRRHRAVRQQPGEDLRQRRRVRDPRPARAHEHPDGGEVTGMSLPPSAVAPDLSVGRPPLAGIGSHPWVRFGVRRLGRLLISLWVLVTASFLMIHLIPGDPVRAALGPTAPADLVAAKREALGLNDPLLVQYVHYLQNLFTGDLGTSLVSQLPVSQVVAQRLAGAPAPAV